MIVDPRALSALHGIAKLKLNIEMRRFAAYRAHVAAVQNQAETLRDELQAIYASDAEFTIENARLANALAAEKSRSLSRVEEQIRQIMPKFQEARQAAVKELGRAEVIESIRIEKATQRKLKIARRVATE